MAIFGWIAVDQRTASRAVGESCEVVSVSRYNHWRYELLKPFEAFFFWIVVAPLLLSFFLAVAIVYDTEEAMDRCDQLVCRLTGHRWADDNKWGVEPVCLNCGARRRADDEVR